MNARFLIVNFTWKDTAKVKELEPIFGTALDWMRISYDCWILWTNSDVEKWYTALQPHLGANDHILIAELNLRTSGANYTGWQPKWVWSWMDKHRS